MPGPWPGTRITAHPHEFLYVWGNEGDWRLTQTLSAADLALTDEMQRYWVNLARSGDPNGPGLPVWPRYQRGEDPYLAISAARIAAQTALRADICPLFVRHWSNPGSYDARPAH